MSEHTAGPWEADGNSADGSFEIWSAREDQKDERIVCWQIPVTSRSPRCLPEESAANARLIAAAPDLLEALIAITDQLERVGDTRERKDGQFITAARAAIARATGQPGGGE